MLLWFISMSQNCFHEISFFLKPKKSPRTWMVFSQYYHLFREKGPQSGYKYFFTQIICWNAVRRDSLNLWKVHIRRAELSLEIRKSLSSAWPQNDRVAWHVLVTMYLRMYARIPPPPSLEEAAFYVFPYMLRTAEALASFLFALFY